MKIKGKLINVIFSQDLIKNQGLSYIQAPKILVIENRLYLFFTSRKLTSTNFPESNIYFVEISKKFKALKPKEVNQVIEIGQLGEFNEHGNAYFSVIKENNQLFGFFSGLSRKESTGIETSIGVSTSDLNTFRFKKIGPGPLISASLFQPMLIGNPYVYKQASLYYMFYIYGEQWLKKAESNGQHARVYKIGLKVGPSIYNLDKTYNNIIENVLGPNECQATPCVFNFNGMFHMVFCYRSHVNFRLNPNSSYKIGYATSKDLINWHRKDENLILNSTNTWDLEMQCYPSVFEFNNKWYLLYNGNQFGRYAIGIFELNIF